MRGSLRDGLTRTSPLPSRRRPDERGTLRAAVFRVVDSSPFSFAVIALVLLNVVLGLVATGLRDGTAASPSERIFLDVFTMFELVSWLLFLAEYGLRLWSCVEDEDSKGRWRWQALT